MQVKKKILKPLIVIFTTSLFAFLITSFSLTSERSTAAIQPVSVAKTDSLQSEESIYDNLHLDSSGLSREAFDRAVMGYEHLKALGKIKNPDILSIVDFSLPSTKKRLFVIDMKNRMLLFNTLVSHGKNSGKDMASAFSNALNSFKSSLGFFTTADTYNGEHGLSLRLVGEEPGINDNALARGIVIHSASYVNESLGKLQGYIGRSLGCPAIPENVHRKVINAIRDGSCLFLYSPDKKYASRTRLSTPDIAGL